MKKYYEVALMQHVHGSVDNDYETVWFECESGCSYRTCKEVAKELSKHIGEVFIKDVCYIFNGVSPEDECSGHSLDAGLAAVKIVCYTMNEDSYYEPLFYEYFTGGRVDHRVNFKIPTWMR